MNMFDNDSLKYLEALSGALRGFQSISHSITIHTPDTSSHSMITQCIMIIRQGITLEH